MYTKDDLSQNKTQIWEISSETDQKLPESSEDVNIYEKFEIKILPKAANLNDSSDKNKSYKSKKNDKQPQKNIKCEIQKIIQESWNEK